MKLTRWLGMLALGLSSGCGDGGAVRDGQALEVLKGIPESTWTRLASERFYFGHQSVGYDIVNGVDDLVKLDPRIGLRIVETSDATAFDTPLFAHSKNGVNKKPDLKIEAFERAVDGALGNRVDVAFYKFCYVDITPETDVEALFETYRASMGRLRDRFPATTFVHVTSPVTVVESGPKAWAKRVLGRPLAGEAANAARTRFNRLMKSAYEGKEPVFDLAGVESTYPDGTASSFKWEGSTYPKLIAGYSYDGRHLNEPGRRWVAAHLLRFLGELPAKAKSVNVGAAEISDGRGGTPPGARGTGQGG
jgi:hypothetical protein